MDQDQLQKIEQKVDRLISLCSRLHKENLALKEREANLLRERSKLIEKNEQARHRVEGMITRLKSLNNEG
ncbi:TIGR02449 family protein [Porticoccaceae bacterium LTM1]|nr:TIGR02449 family protein [Porticoccaceae bacterium LTM1]